MEGEGGREWAEDPVPIAPFSPPGGRQSGQCVRSLLTHMRAVAAGHSNVAETDLYIHTVEQREAPEQTRPQTPLLPLPRRKLAKRGEDSNHWQPPRPSLLISPHQTKRPSAQLGCSRSMALGSMKISWETCRTGLALSIESSLGGIGENVRLGTHCRIWCETGMRPHLQGGLIAWRLT